MRFVWNLSIFNRIIVTITSQERNPQRITPSLQQWGSFGRFPVVKFLHLSRLGGLSLTKTKPSFVNLHKLVPHFSTSSLSTCNTLHTDTESLVSLRSTCSCHISRPWRTTSSTLTIPKQPINSSIHFLSLNVTP